MEAINWFGIVVLMFVGLLYVEWVNHADDEFIQAELERRQIVRYR